MGFLVMILSSQTQQQQQAAWQKYQSDYAAYQKKVADQSSQLSKKYYAQFKPYTSKASKFDATSVKTLQKSDLKVGSGETIKDTTKFAAYYILWLPDGKIKEQSIKDSSLSAPLTIDGLKNSSVVDGWKEGIEGMKIGGVRELAIPSDKAYGKTGRTDGTGQQSIAPDTPLKFIIMAIPAPEKIAEPTMSPEVLQYIQEQYGAQ